MGLSAFQTRLMQLADVLDQEWKELAYKQSAFPDLSAKHLKSLKDFSVPSFSEIASQLATIDLPPQTFNGLDFSDFPLTLVRKENFCIDIYFWNRSDTGIHDHHFHGAFKILAGSSMQVNYEFKTKIEHGMYLSEGELQQTSAKNLNQGDVEAIHKHDRFIHQVFHVEIPALTLCIRTPVVLSEAPLSVYMYPKYKIPMKKLDINKYKWLLGLRVRLQMNEVITEEVPLSNDEIINTLYKSMAKRDILDPLVFDFLSAHLSARDFATDFISICKKSETTELKLKRLAIISYLESQKAAKNE